MRAQISCQFSLTTYIVWDVVMLSVVCLCVRGGGDVPYPMMHWDRGRGLSSFWLEGLDGKDLSRRWGHTSPLLTRAAQETNRPWYSRTWTVSVQCLNPSTSEGWREVMFSLANESCDFKPLGYFWRHWNILVFQTSRGRCGRGFLFYRINMTEMIKIQFPSSTVTVDLFVIQAFRIKRKSCVSWPSRGTISLNTVTSWLNVIFIFGIV